MVIAVDASGAVTGEITMFTSGRAPAELSMRGRVQGDAISLDFESIMAGLRGSAVLRRQ